MQKELGHFLGRFWGHHLVGVVVVEITFEDLDLVHPRPIKSRLLMTPLGVSDADVPNCCSKSLNLALVSFSS